MHVAFAFRPLFLKPTCNLMKRFTVHSLLFAAFLASSASPAVAHSADFLSSEPLAATLAEQKDKPDAVKHYNLGPDKVAIRGYDPVAYFSPGKALKGRKEISASHRGVTYLFAVEENKKLFAQSPEKYVPAYGGWCATAMAKGEK